MPHDKTKGKKKGARHAQLSREELSLEFHLHISHNNNKETDRKNNARIIFNPNAMF